MERLLKAILFPLHIIFYPFIYLFKKLPFATRRKIISKTTGFHSLVGKSLIIFRHVFSHENGSKERVGSSGLMYLILLLFTGFVSWAYFAKFDQVITAEGKVYPFSRLQEIEHYEGGLLDKIHVKRGEAVRKNQLLVSLSPLSADSDFNIQKANIALLLIKKARLEAEYLNKNNFSISEDIKEKYLQIFDNEYALFLKRKALFDEEILKSQNNIQMASARSDAAEAAFVAASEEYEVVTNLYQKGLESKLSKIKSERSFSESVASREIAEQELNKAELELNSLMLDRQAKVLAELSEVKSEYLAAYEGIRVAADKADRTQIRAPIDGIVNRVLISTKGSVVKPGETVVEVVPADQTIVVEANVLPSDIGFVTKEQRAQVKITAYDFSVFGALTGSVSVVGADTITNENGENFYVVKIDLDQDFLEVNNRSLKVIPGMTAQVDIITGQRSPLEYIFSPITKTLQEAFREK